ncbi:MAG TPA: SdrD B-like domain-containing protein, partial [Saprospiraceae bacterium]|nr:SdrD B-like domain-containing protein [Saprospiraceae bacterium]
GTVFEDNNNNQLPDAGEGLSGVTLNVFADNNTDGKADNNTIVATTMTASTGTYQLSNVPVGNYVLVEINPLNFISVKDYDLTNDADLVPNTNMNNDTIPVTLNNNETDAENYFIDDRLPPSITCPANVTIECTASTDPSNTGMATATDHCDGNVMISYADVTVGAGCPQEYIITRTWTATDNCGNSSTCSQLITVDDSMAPAITCPANITITCTASTLPGNTGSATATDSCDPSPVISWSDVTTTGTCPQAYSITRTWTAADHCGNSSTCQQIISIIDNAAPAISCPTDVTIQCTASTQPSNTGNPTSTDNCDPSPIITFTDVTASGSCPQAYSIIR